MTALRFMALAILAAAAPALAATGQITLVNQTGGPLADLAIRGVGSTEWQPPEKWNAVNGARRTVPVPGDGCAYDIRAVLPPAITVTWQRVNLCDTKVVVLNRRPDGTLWVDYE